MALENLAFVFPGQGSQSVGMLAELGNEQALITQTFAEASDAIGLDLWALAQEGPAETQNLTENTQPLILTASVAIWRLWCSNSEVRPAQLAGHSLGEFSALVCASALPLAEAVKLVKKRGEFMQSAVAPGEGAMAAVIGLDDELVNAACAASAANEVVAAVNYNSPGQVVIAGHAAAVERAIVACKDAGAKRALPLPVSAPFHTSLMQEAGDKLAVELEACPIVEPEIPVIHNVHAQAEQDPAEIKRLLVRQISAPVPWVQCVHALKSKGVDTLVECGPGKVLTGLARRIDKTLQARSLQSMQDISDLAKQ